MDFGGGGLDYCTSSCCMDPVDVVLDYYKDYCLVALTLVPFVLEFQWELLVLCLLYNRNVFSFHFQNTLKLQ